MTNSNNKGLFGKLLAYVEKSGNALPQPVTLFFIFILIVLAASFIAGISGFSAVHPATGEKISAVNLLSKDGIQRILTDMIDVFVEFPPLGLVLVVMLGIGVADYSGLIRAMLKAFVSGVPKQLITVSLVLAGMMSSLAADAGYVVLIPLGAVIFYGIGRHPIAGLAAAFAGVSGGFSANLVLTSLDPLLAGFTQSAAQLENIDYIVDPTANWYLMAAMVPVFALAGTLVTEKIVIKHLGEYDRSQADVDENDSKPLVRREKIGLIGAFASTIVLLGLFAWMTIPENGILRDINNENTFRPFFDAIVVLMLILFFVPGLVYGLIVKSIKGEKDVSDMMTKSMEGMGAYIVLAFVAAQFVAYFNWSNLGIIVAIKGAGFLQSIDFTGIPLMLSFIIIASIINIFIGSASAKWAIMAPVFVPMFMLMGYSPELTQAAYRMGDSYSNILTPLLPYFPLIIIFAQKYDKNIGIGTIISTMIPYSIAFAISSMIMLMIWMYFEIPLGPGAPLYYIP
ncbi:MAG: AbgT family transporter [Chitinophagaceae bacterium]|nr:MAG: AbgT family transporter [Chitinophagaceae bacterium]